LGRARDSAGNQLYGQLHRRGDNRPGTGGAASFYIKQTSHFTVNANGELTSQVDNFDATCE